MPREMFTRDELIQALQVAARFLEGFPESLTLAAASGSAAPVDGGLVSRAQQAGDGALVPSSNGVKGLPQPARKQYGPGRAKASADWTGVPRAARQIADLVLRANQPLTSHAIMSELKIARSTFNNAMSILLARKILAAVPLSGGAERH